MDRRRFLLTPLAGVLIALLDVEGQQPTIPPSLLARVDQVLE